MTDSNNNKRPSNNDMSDFLKNRQPTPNDMFDFLKNRQPTPNDLFGFTKSKQNHETNKISHKTEASSQNTTLEQKEKYRETLYKLERWENYYEAVETLKEALSIFPNDLEFMDAICQNLLEIHKYNDAIKISNNALNIAQNISSKYYIGIFFEYLGCAYLDINEFEKAKMNFLYSISNDSSISFKYYCLGTCYYNLGNYDKAIKTFNKLKIIDHSLLNSPEAKNMIQQSNKRLSITSKEYIHLRKGIRLEEQDKKDTALKEYYKAYNTNPQAIEVLCRLSILLSECDNVEEAIVFAFKAMAAQINCEDYENTELFLTLFEKISNHHIKSSDDNINKKCQILYNYYKSIYYGDLQIKNEHNYNKAYEMYERAIAFYSDDYEAYDKIIDLCLYRKNYKKAFYYLNAGINLAQKLYNSEKISKYYHLSSSCFWLLGDNEKAIILNENALKYTSDLNSKLAICYDLSCLLEKENRINDSLEKIEECQRLIRAGAEENIDIQSHYIKIKALMDINSSINKANDLYIQGINLFNEDKMDLAIKCFQESLSLSPLNIKTMLRLSQALINQDRKKDAFLIDREGYLISIKTKDFTFIDRFAYQAASYLVNTGNNFEKALEYAKQATKHQPNNPDYHSLVGQCYMGLKDYYNASNAYKISYSLNHNPQTLDIINQCESMF